MKTCDIVDCERQAEWTVSILLFPPKPFTGSPAKREMPHKLCSVHKENISVHDFLDDEHYVDICNTFRRHGRKIPARETAQLSFKKFEEPKLVITESVEKFERGKVVNIGDLPESEAIQLFGEPLVRAYKGEAR